MARQLKKPAKPEEPDLLPAMGLFTILIPMLLSMTAFSKLAIVEVNMPERSVMQMDNEPPPDPDDQALNLTIGVAEDSLSRGYLFVVARGGQEPYMYFTEMWTFRCKTDAKVVTYPAKDVKSLVANGERPKCKDGSEMWKNSRKPSTDELKKLDDEYLHLIERIELWSLLVESETDPGKIVWAAYSNGGSAEEPLADSVYVDVENNEFLMAVGDGPMGASAPASLKKPGPGAMVATLKENSGRKLKQDAKTMVYPLSAYDQIAKKLIAIHTAFIDLEDVDKINITADMSAQFDKLIQLMDRSKDAGFVKIGFGVLEGG